MDAMRRTDSSSSSGTKSSGTRVVRTISVPDEAVANPANDALTASKERYWVTPSHEITVGRSSLPPSPLARRRTSAKGLRGQIARQLPPAVGDRQTGRPNPLKLVGGAVGLIDLHHLKLEIGSAPGKCVQTRTHGHVPSRPRHAYGTHAIVDHS